MSLLSEIAYNYPALPPPPGVKSNFDNPETQSAPLIIFNAVFITPMLLMVAIRIYSKAHITRTLWWDDYLRLGYGRHLWDIRAISLKPDVVHRLSSISVIYPVVIFMVKLSILLLCLRLFKVDRLFLRLVYFGVIFQTLFYSAVFFFAIVTVTRCDSAAALTIRLCKDQYILVITQGVVNVITDFYVLALPITRVVQLQMPFWRKVGLCAIFLTGLAACAVSVARLIIAGIRLHHPDTLWNAALISQLSVIEMNTGIIASCMTVLPAFFNKTKFFHAFTYHSLRSLLFSGRSRSKSSDHSFTSDAPQKTNADLVDGNASYKNLNEESVYPLGSFTAADTVGGGTGAGVGAGRV